MNFLSPKASLCEMTQWKIGLDIVAIIANDKRKRKATWKMFDKRKISFQEFNFLHGIHVAVIFLNVSLTSLKRVNFNSI